jgi:hypothetical protein
LQVPPGSPMSRGDSGENPALTYTTVAPLRTSNSAMPVELRLAEAGRHAVMELLRLDIDIEVDELALADRANELAPGLKRFEQGTHRFSRLPPYSFAR